MATRIIKGSAPGSRKSGLNMAQFTQQVVQEEFEAILQEQDPVIAKLNTVTGALKNNRRINVNIIGAGVSATLSFPAHLRYLDMKRLGNRKGSNLKLYNPLIYGRLYGSMLRRLSTEYIEEIEATIPLELDI